MWLYKIKIWINIIAFYLVLTGSVSQAVTLRPVDQAIGHPELLRFRQELVKIVATKDTQALLAHISPHIKFSFGALENSKDGFIQFWKLNTQPDKSEIWQELEAVLALGGVYEEDKNPDGKKMATFSAPYLFAAFPDNLDAFTHAVIIGEAVNVREKPSSQSRVVDNLSHDIVKIDYMESEVRVWDSPEKRYYWQKIVTPNGKSGYVYSKYIRTPIEYRAIFSNESGAWLMTVFIAGD